MVSHIKIYCILVISLTFLVPDYSASQWLTGSVDTLTHDKFTDFVTSPKSIAIDNENTLYVVWQKVETVIPPNTSGVFFSKKSANGNWSIPTSVSDTLLPSVRPSIVVLKNTHKIFVVYTEYADKSNGEIILAVKTENSDWSKINLSNSTLSDDNPTLDIDLNENIHVSWQEYSNGNAKIKYCSNVIGKWKTSTLIDNYFGDNYYAIPSLTVNPEGIAHIIYISLFQMGFKNIHAENLIPGGDQWKFELLPGSINGGGIMRLDKSGNLHYVYNYAKGFQYQTKVFYTNKKSQKTGWSNPESINDEFDGICTSLEIGNDGNIYISLDSLTNAFIAGKIYYATNRSGKWKLSLVSNNENSFFSNLKIDNNGFGHVISTFPSAVFNFLVSYPLRYISSRLSSDLRS